MLSAVASRWLIIQTAAVLLIKSERKAWILFILILYLGIYRSRLTAILQLQKSPIANAIRLFEGELYYDTEQGVPYFDEILGQPHSFALFKHRMEEAALRVDGVKDVVVSIQRISDRRLSGGITFKDENNQTHTVEL